jgi:hypothetical protein
MIIAAPLAMAKLWNQCRCSSTRKWIKKMYTSTMEYYSATKNIAGKLLEDQASAILATQEAEIRRIAVRSHPGQRVHETLP